MEDKSLLQHLDHKPVIVQPALFQLSRRTHQQVHGKLGSNRQADSGGQLAGGAGMTLDDHQIHIRVLCWPAIGIGAKQDDLVGIEAAGHFICELEDRAWVGQLHALMIASLGLP